MQCRATTTTGDRCSRDAAADTMPEMCAYHWGRKQSGQHVPFVAYWNVASERDKDSLLTELEGWFRGEVAAGDASLQQWADKIAAVREL
jgi:hypothetical protein